ncbi:Phosphate-selective porin O and P [Candidatus Magnetomorum sp. HK-1]|nr:Phosphate-selective porin O and P [Candidatus Magnetomorum sp. HK-1]
MRNIIILNFIFCFHIFLVFPCKAIDIVDLKKGISVHPGGTCQFDYRNISNAARADSRFDIRRARLNVQGHISPKMKYKLECEFQGNETRKLIDAYGEYQFYPSIKIQFGQFKVPFSREWLTSDKAFPFSERSIGFSLQAGRDIGVMLVGNCLNNFFSYNIGAFNGDGIDGSSRGNQKDDPEVALRCVIQPFSLTKIPFLTNFFSGISLTEGRIDLNNISLNVKSTGMIGTQRSLYSLNANTKFGALLDVNKRQRMCFESGLFYGPVAFYFEHQRFRYVELRPVRGNACNANFYSWYTSMVINLTGESININKPYLTLKNTIKRQLSTIWQIAIRREHFSGDSHWIIKNSYNAAKEAEAYSLALNWLWDSQYRFLIDYSYTDISDPLRIRINPDGSIEYMKSETSLTFRFQINF